MQEYNGYNGLSQKEVAERAERGLCNISSQSVGKSIKRIIITNTFTYFNFIFAVITVLLCLVGSFRNLTFLPIIIGNTLVGIFQEIRAKRTLEKMSLLNAPHAVVIRDGERIRVRSEQLVQDDIVVFSAGDQICADARVLCGSVRANEALLTGEEDEIEKPVGAELLSGSFIVSGECLAILEKVGEQSYISKLTSEAKTARVGEQSEMIRSINRIVKWMGIILIPIGAILFCQSWFFNGETLKDSVVSTVAAIIGMIPEGLYLLTTVALALGTIRLAKRKVLLNDMKSIESLARVDVLCVDKTGTITEPKINVYKTVAVCDDSRLSGSFHDMLCRYIGSSPDNNATMQALREHFPEYTSIEKIKQKSAMPFDSDKKFGAVTYENGTWVLGAPDFVMPRQDDDLKDLIAGYMKKGYRVLLFAFQSEDTAGRELSGNITPIGLIILSNAIRKNAKATFGYFKEQGVDIKVISGDHPETVAEIARLAEIDNASDWVDAATLDTDEKLYLAAERYTVFGRVTPKQKQKLVRALQKKGHTVAMTGDGVNDILAMKDADCGIAMASGSEAVSQAAKVVLLDSDFAHMPNVVAEGRRVVNNIQRSATLFLVKNIFSLLLAITASVFMIRYPLEPAQISLISMFTIGMPGFLLALEKNDSRISGSFLRNVLIKALPAGLTDAVAVGSLAISCSVFGIQKDEISTAATLVLAAVGFMILYRISMPLSKYRTAVFALSIVGMVLCLLFLPKLFAVIPISMTILQLVAVFSLAAGSIFAILAWIAQKWETRIKKKRAARPEK